MLIPKPIYETLPTLYILGGVAAMTSVDSFMSYTCGLLMGVTGIVILFMRRNYRLVKADFMRQSLRTD